MARAAEILFRPFPPRLDLVVRVLAASLIAPAPFALFFYATFELSSAIRVYIAAIAIGFPAYALIRWQRWSQYWQFALLGLLLGALAAAITVGATEVVQHWDRPQRDDDIPTLTLVGFSLVLGGIQGLVIASLSWLFVRSVSPRPNPSIEGTASSGLRPPPAAPHVKR